LYYLRYPLDWLGASNGKPMNADDADALARRALNRADAIWLVVIPDALATDPQKLLETYIARALPKRLEQTFNDKRLALYARDERDVIQVARENFKPQFLHDAKIGESRLLGFDLPVREARAGDPVIVTTYWDSPEKRLALQLNQISGDTVQNVMIQVPAGNRVRVMTRVNLPLGDARAFAIRVSMAGQTIELAKITGEPRTELTRAGNITHPTNFLLGEAIRLVGYDLPQRYFRVGDSIPLTLYWRADRPLAQSYTVFVHLRGERFNPKQNNPLWGQSDRAPMPPPNAWRVNEIISDAYRLGIDPDAPPGKYKIEIGMYDAATGTRLQTDQGDSVIVGEIEIRGR
jgi:hypothetical protein